ncbi:TPA: hypothetical protein N0F65_000051 [Lagenidium giganteum]|uniref:Proton-dependent Oligopeptide Transporter (POT) Family n=1 Tax=Lagenidium giganteum TaxID=4803 RepID=A0AAV2YQN3_9STRA|nr:TPA: hypothetical protein N0F65_000051 [Lagenidium giganteum]
MGTLSRKASSLNDGMTSPMVPYQTLWEARPRKYKNVLLQVCLFILIMELAERLSYYGINQGLKNFMQAIGWSAVSASALKSTWTSICYLSPLLGAYIADEKWGRFKTILIFGVWYCIGDFLVAISAYPTIMANSAIVNPIFVIGLFLGIGVGTGAIKSNVITFGADQFDPHDPSEVAQKETYFSYFYFCINVGACVSYGYLSVLSVEGSGAIPASYGYFATYMICAAVMALAIVILVVGYSRYVHMPPKKGAMSTLGNVLVRSIPYSFGAKMIVLGFVVFLVAFILNVIAAFLSGHGKTGEHISFLAGALIVVGCFCWIYYGMDPSFLDNSKLSSGGPFDHHLVDEIKKVVRVLPFASFTIIWQCAYDQTDANFQSMTQQCDLRLNTNDRESAQVPGAMLGVFAPIVVVIVVPILDAFIYPLYTRGAGKPPSAFGKAFVGLLIACTAVFWAGIFETIRRDSGPIEPTLRDNGSKQPMNNLYWAAAIPNYVLIALAECLVNVTAYDVFYSEVPSFLKSTCQAINLFMVSMGSILTSVFTIMFQSYIPNNLNDGHLEYMYYTVGAVSVINLALFVVVMRKMQFGMSSSRPAGGHDDLLHVDEGAELCTKDSTASRISYVSNK